MSSEISDNSRALCVACLSSERILNLVIDYECKMMFGEMLDNLEFMNHPIPLCYECSHRLNNIVCFKKQVMKAHRFLLRYTNHSKTPQSMSTLAIRKTEISEWEPNPTLSNPQDIHTIQLDSSPKRRNTDECDTSPNFDSECETYLYSEAPNFIIIQDENSQERKTRSKTKKIDKSLTNETDVPSQDATLDLKVEDASENSKNPLNDVKEEPEDDSETQDFSDMDVLLKCETKYEFSDSDDEPLKSKCTRTKKVKRVKAQKRERPAGVVSSVWVQKKLQQLNVPAGQLEMVVLSWEEVEVERQKSLAHLTYTRHEFRCASCVIGFNHRFKLESHMKKHSTDAGELECSVCKTRFKSQSALLCHTRRHRTRWRCSQCHALFSRAGIAADHHTRAHGAPPPTHTCHVCGHSEPSLGKLRVHLKNHAERQHCEQCGKSFRDKSSLRTHLYIHTNQKDFSCDVCEKRFRFKKALEIHRITHQAPELLYCRDCDMNFKNRLSYYQHINYSMKHIHPDKIKYACEFCSRRFSKPARLQEHRFSVHLKLAPHLCTVDGCTFASASRPALRTHVRMVHRNKRLERNHVCHTCGKAYTTKKILEGHIRSHTGERPFACAACPATFSHDAALYNHKKLVHKTPFVPRRKTNRPRGTVTPDWAEAPACIVSGALDSNTTHSDT